MNTFIGNIEARLDGKGRVFIPASYRKILAEMGSTHIVMRRDTDNECVHNFQFYFLTAEGGLTT